ncbi:MAG: hypothetical protein RBU30_07805 [Polyangia bacterium]|jgi:hypothetical protein|nr:hypothetical protein [Polyangia bacterium]
MNKHIEKTCLACLLGLSACGSTPHDQPDGSHIFPDGTVFDSTLPDARADASPPKAQCEDGIDNDNDGLIDYPDDPGCTSASDPDESNPPYCGLDDQGQMIPIRVLPPTGHLVQNTSNGQSFHQGSCGGEGASELIFQLEVSVQVEGLWVSTVSEDEPPITLMDTVVYVRRDTCDASSAEVGCTAATSGQGGVDLVLQEPPLGTYYVFVDGAGPGAQGQFLLRVRGLIPLGSPCDPSDQTLVCGPGIICDSPTPGDPTVCMVPYCNDGADNDSDGLIDYPYDPGCESPLDNSEADSCPGLGCPECADGIDNDADGFVDWPADPGCRAASDPLELDECVTGLDLTPLPSSGIATGTFTYGDPSLTAGSCSMYSGPESVFPLKLPYGADEVDITLTSMSWTYVSLYVRAEECADGTELGCKSNWNNTESLSLRDLGPGTYFIFADSQDLYSNDSFTLTVEARLPVGAICDLGSQLAQCALGGTCQDVGGGLHQCVATACNNGQDDDGDGYVDWPYDPGCTSKGDNDETDSCDPVNNPASCPACWNGLDDDGDGFVDFGFDRGCSSAADTSEIDDCVPGLPLEDVPASGATSFAINPSNPSLIYGSCSYSTYSGEERAYRLELPLGASKVTFQASSQNYTYIDLYARQGDCETGPEVGCVSNWNTSEALSLMNLAPGTYFLLVDTQDVYSSDTITVSFSVQLPIGAPCSPTSPVASCAPGSLCQDVGGAYQCAATSCNNGLDDDGDGLVDFPWDPGCTGIDDNDEADSCFLNPSLCPACLDGLDNDSDGLADYPADPGCSSASDTSEADLCAPGAPFTDITATGQATGSLAGSSAFNGSCGGNWEPEKIYVLRLPGAATRVEFTATSDLDSWGDPNIELLLYARLHQCDQASAELGCVSAYYPSPTASLVLQNVPAGHVFLFVDSDYVNYYTGIFNLTATATLASGAACLPGSTVVQCPTGTACTDLGSEFRCQ